MAQEMPGLPVVIQGAIDQWPASEWTLDSLKEKVGENEVYVRSNTNCEDYRSGRKYNIRKTTFAEYVSDLRRENSRGSSSYLAVQNIRQSFPQLENDVTVPSYVGKLHGGPYMWIAKKGHYEYCHYDPDDGLLVVIAGLKEVRLYGCDPTPMYPNPKGSKGRTVQSLVDCDNPDLEKHPLFKDVTCHHTTLSPGEMLYIPAMWWHQVTSPEITISVNMFWGNAGVNDYLSKIMSPKWWGAFSQWLLNIVEQNRPFPAFPRILSRLPEALDNFFLKQWHEKPSPDQMDKLVKTIMEYLAIDELPSEMSAGKNPPPLQIRGLLWRS